MIFVGRKGLSLEPVFPKKKLQNDFTCCIIYSIKKKAVMFYFSSSHNSNLILRTQILDTKILELREMFQLF